MLRITFFSFNFERKIFAIFMIDTEKRRYIKTLNKINID